jgi:hypothetical protein
MKFSNRTQVLAAIAIAWVWFSLAGCSGKSDDSTVRAESRLGRSGFQARELRAFAVLRIGLRAIPVPFRRKIRSQLSERIHNLDFEAARYTRTRVSGIWIFSARGTTCVARTGDAAMACDSKGHFVSRGLSFAVFEAPSKTVDSLHGFVSVGVAPDWVQTVRLKVGQRNQEVAVHSNTYGLRSNSPIFVEGLEGRGEKRVK